MRGFTLVELLIAMAILAIVSAIAVPAYDAYVERARIAQAVADIGLIDMEIERFEANTFTLPDDLADMGVNLPLDPWERPYQYLRLRGNNDPGVNGQRRRDRNLNPINSDYDLYSMGADGDSRAALMARPSRDDVVRASDGNFVGLAEEY